MHVQMLGAEAHSSIAFSRMSLGRGGPRRTKVPECDAQQLSDSLEKWTKHMGASAFKFGKYATMKKSNGVDGTALSSLFELVELLVDVSGQVLFKYSDLKGVVSMLLQKYQVASQGFSLEMLPSLPGDIANAIMTICTHARRLKKKEVFLAAIAKCTKHQTEKLLELRNLVAGEGDDNETQAEEQAEEEEEAEVTNTQDVLALQIPLTPKDEDEDEEEEEDEDEEETIATAPTEKDLLMEALKTLPIPARKENVRKSMTLKRPAAAEAVLPLMKKPASMQDVGASDGCKNFVFQSLTWGQCKAEFYTQKSYVRYLDSSSSKWHLVVSCEGQGHQAKLRLLVDKVKLKSMTKEKLIKFRQEL